MAEEGSLHSPTTPLPPPALQPTSPPAKAAFSFNFISVAVEKGLGTVGRHRSLRRPTVTGPALSRGRGEHGRGRPQQGPGHSSAAPEG